MTTQIEAQSPIEVNVRLEEATGGFTPKELVGRILKIIGDEKEARIDLVFPNQLDAIDWFEVRKSEETSKEFQFKPIEFLKALLDMGGYICSYSYNSEYPYRICLNIEKEY